LRYKQDTIGGRALLVLQQHIILGSKNHMTALTISMKRASIKGAPIEGLLTKKNDLSLYGRPVVCFRPIGQAFGVYSPGIQTNVLDANRRLWRILEESSSSYYIIDVILRQIYWNELENKMSQKIKGFWAARERRSIVYRIQP
jgi:hypothetical protein